MAQRGDGLLQRVECVCQHRDVGVHGVGFAPTGDQPGRLLMQRGKNDVRNIGMARKRRAERNSVGYVAGNELRSSLEVGCAARECDHRPIGQRGEILDVGPPNHAERTDH